MNNKKQDKNNATNTPFTKAKPSLKIPKRNLGSGTGTSMNAKKNPKKNMRNMKTDMTTYT